jgi:hypothetical protein
MSAAAANLTPAEKMNWFQAELIPLFQRAFGNLPRFANFSPSDWEHQFVLPNEQRIGTLQVSESFPSTIERVRLMLVNPGIMTQAEMDDFSWIRNEPDMCVQIFLRYLRDNGRFPLSSLGSHSHPDHPRRVNPGDAWIYGGRFAARRPRGGGPGGPRGGGRGGGGGGRGNPPGPSNPPRNDYGRNDRRDNPGSGGYDGGPGASAYPSRPPQHGTGGRGAYGGGGSRWDMQPTYPAGVLVQVPSGNVPGDYVIQHTGSAPVGFGMAYQPHGMPYQTYPPASFGIDGARDEPTTPGLPSPTTSNGSGLRADAPEFIRGNLTHG